MIIELRLTGNGRKELAKTVSEIIGVPAEYQYMRCYLLHLGMIGREYKAARKVLIRNLSGNASFRKVSDSDEVSE